MKVFTQNEYSPLRSIIVGSAQQSAWPTNDTAFNRSIALSTYEGKLIPGPLPNHIIQEAEEDLERLVDALVQEEIKVYRPQITQHNWS